MDKLCKFCWEQTPALRWQYQMRATVQKSAKDKTPLGGTMCKEGNITIPLCVIGAVIVLAMIPCMCACHARKKRKMQKKESASC
ncbi:MAG: hypothetical protein IJX76_01115 [Clostridia bacterium]|nr:hypothetical protein [Clostridia bacterium]